MPLSKEWKNMQALNIIAALKSIKDLPYDLQFEIAQATLGTLDGDAVKQLVSLHDIQQKVNSQGVASLARRELVAYLASQHYDPTSFGGWYNRLQSLVTPVEQGALTPRGSQLLNAWAQNRTDKDHASILQSVRQLLSKQEE